MVTADAREIAAIGAARGSVAAAEPCGPEAGLAPATMPEPHRPRLPLDAVTGIAVGVVFGIAAWCLFAAAVVGAYR